MLSKLLKSLFTKNTVQEVISLKRYRDERAEAERLYFIAQFEAKLDLDKEISVPRSIYEKRINSARADFLRVEEEAWQRHLRRVGSK